MTRTTLKLSLLVVALSTAFAAQAQDKAALASQHQAALARLSADSGGVAQVSMHAATGTARFVRAAPGGKISLPRSALAASEAGKQGSSTQWLTNYGGLFGITSPAAELSAARVSSDVYGGTHFTYKQMYKGVPVFGGEVKSHFDPSGNLTVVNGTFVPDIAVNPTPTHGAAAAAAAAMARVKADLGQSAMLKSARLSASTPALMIYREGLAKGVEGMNYLAWQVEVGNRVDVRDFVYVDAHTGKVIDKISGIHEAKNRRAYDGQSATAPGPNYPNNPFWVEGNPFPTGNVEADNMIAASSEIYDLFKKAFGRDSYDGKGATMDSIFNRGNGCPNASWNGTFISFCPGTTTDDVTAHEWGHAYTEYTHGLIYAWQSGALNESYSDIWGETVDRLNGRGTDTPDATRTAGSCSAFTNASQVNITAPSAIAGVRAAGTAAFGPQTFTVPATNVVVVNDGVGTSTDGCETPFVNAAAVSGKIALIDRGVCGFAVKVKNAQLNGAIGVIIGNNATGIANMAGADATITIPSLLVGQGDATAIKAQISTVTASLQRGPGSDNSVRWLIGEDSTAFLGAIRDMYNPTCYGNPGKVSDAQYTCDTANTDSGGVHTNSGVPNHAYALTVDGGTYNGQTITGIGLTKAAHIYYRAQSVYQGPASAFADHADALVQSCADLTGQNLASLTTGAPSGEVITAADCSQLPKVATAVEFRTPVTQCNFVPLLAQSPPPLCPSGTQSTIASDGFDGGRKGGLKWQVSHAATGAQFVTRDWGVVNGLPSGRPGYAMFASDPNTGTCAAGSDEAGLQRLESPEITVPASTTTLRMAFDHWVATEAGYDGGNLKISVNGGAYTLVKAADFIYNPYNATLTTAAGGNNNPLAGQPAFSGSDGGSVGGSWGRSIVNLAPYAVSGDKVKLRFEIGNDCGGGIKGWYLDDVTVYRCTAP